MYDAIVIGARCAGSPRQCSWPAKATECCWWTRPVPERPVSTHIVWPHGAELLAQWGLLTRLAATGLPPIAGRCSSMSDPSRCAARSPTPTRAGRILSASHVLDRLLVDAAVASGVEVREAFTVDRCCFQATALLVSRASGAERRRGARAHRGRGRRHPLAGSPAVKLRVRRPPVATCGYYSYFSGVPQDDIEQYVRDHCAFGGAPTNDGLIS